MKSIKKSILCFAAFIGLSIPVFAGDKPEFPGGEAALNSYFVENMKYPAMARENGVEGIVGVQFIVHTDGSIGAIKIVRMVDPDLEQEAVRLVKTMPAWIPAEKNGTPVEASTQVNVPFKLN